MRRCAAEVVAQQERLEPEASGVEIPKGVFAAAREIADGFIGDGGAKVRRVCAAIVTGVGDGDGVLVNIEADVECATVLRG